MGKPVYRHRHEVSFCETNLVGNVYFAHYLMWQGHCRERFLAEHAPGLVQKLQSGEFALVTVSCSATFHAESFALEAIDIEMSLRSHLDSRVVMDFSYKRRGLSIATGRQEIACMERDGTEMRPARIPGDLRAALESYE